MNSVTIYHNPRCSKSREALSLLEQKGSTITIVEYLKTPLTAPALKSLLAKLGLQAFELIRKGEPLFKELAIDWTDDKEAFDALLSNPILMERPVIELGDKAVVGRPPSKLNELFPSVKE